MISRTTSARLADCFPRWVPCLLAFLTIHSLLNVVAAGDRPTHRVVDFESLCVYAERAAETPFAPAPELPGALAGLDYDDYRMIAFRPQASVWRQADTPFQLETFHRGYIFFERVGVHTIENGRVSSIPFTAAAYDYRDRLAERISSDLKSDIGHAGLKVVGPLPSSEFMREVATFLGASYFRCLGDGQVYGASARALGINMGMPGPEEFPCFREFWVVKPPVDGRPDGEYGGPRAGQSLVVFAFLDSPSLTGAYQFEITPGDATTCDVRARLFYRHEVAKLCLGAMSSMWMWGQGAAGPADDERPEVHDSDGLLVVHGGGKHVWRGLAQQSYPSVSSIPVNGLAGFGLIQRQRDYERYRDEEAKYHARPSLWIEPCSIDGRQAAWPNGWVELFEMPADHEGYDNIAAWFVPAKHGRPGEPFDVRYRVTFASDESVLGEVSDERPARATAFQIERSADQTTVRVQFEGLCLSASDRAAGRLTANVSATRGSITSVTVPTVPDKCSARDSRIDEPKLELVFTFQPDGNDPVELRASLTIGKQCLTEQWSFLCRPSP